MGWQPERRHVVVVPYDPGWVQAFEREAVQIAAILGEELLAIHHIGSTSVPGLQAKPIIDIMPVVSDIEKVDAYNPAFLELGYEAKGENGIPGRRHFVKGGDLHRTHHIHMYEPDNPEVARHLDFRDYLRAHPDEAERYGRLKAELAVQFPYDIFSYMMGKNDFIRATIQKAQEWRAQAVD